MTVSTLIEARVETAAPEAGAAAALFERARCYYCGDDTAAHFITAEDDLTGRPGRFTFVRCTGCGLVYQSPRPTLAHIKTYYDDEYLAHRKRTDWGLLSPFFSTAMTSLDREKLRIVGRYLQLGRGSSVLDVGCGAGTFLSRISAQLGSTVVGVDFVDLSRQPALGSVEFHCGLFYEQPLGHERFDLVTMWHFLEHDYDPMRSLVHARGVLARDGRLIVEVPRLDSLTFAIFGDRWPGLQAPQHTVLFDRASLLKMVERAGYKVVDYLPYGAFPPYFYVFCGVAFRLLKGRGLNMRKAIYPYFVGQLLLSPVLPLIKRLNLAMQTVICRRTR